jgi:glycosyltransferase involved in cell wall biosynthesis
MRIAYVMTSLGVGGAEKQVVALAERMTARGHAVSLLVLRGRQPEEWPTALHQDWVVRLDMRKTPFSLCAGLAKAKRFLRSFEPDLIHSHTYPANIAARLLKISLPNAAVLSTVHNVYEGAWPRMFAYRITDPLCRHTTAVSQAAADRYVRLKAVPLCKISVLTNGIDTMEFAPNAERRSQLRAEMRVAGEFVWLAAGRIVPAKDYPNLLRAFAKVRHKFPKAQLWIAGESTSAESVAIHALSADLGVAVRWLGLRRDIPALLDAADGFVLSSAWEGMPLAAGEAMAMQMPVIATDVGGVREMVGDAGTIVPAKSPKSLAQAMLALLQALPEARSMIGRAARERIQDYFEINAKIDEWESLYWALLADEK